eukprot:gene17858-biopygen2631
MRTARSGLPPTTREQQDANPTNGRVAPLASASTCTGAPKSITTPGEPGAYLPSGRIVHGWQLLTHYYEKCDGARPGHPAAVHSDPPTDRLTRLPSESRSSVANCIPLDGVYHQFWAAFPSNPTHRKRITNGLPASHGIVTLSDALFQATLAG